MYSLSVLFKPSLYKYINYPLLIDVSVAYGVVVVA